MEKQKLPNQTAIMILGITSFIGCCCTNGIYRTYFSRNWIASSQER